jgi:hypothetical protein
VITWNAVRRHALGLPEVEEETSYGTPAFKLRGKLLARRWQNDPRVLVLYVDRAELELLLRGRPEAFFITPHYAGYPYVLARLDEVRPDELRELLTDAWLLRAPKRMAAAFVAEA